MNETTMQESENFCRGCGTRARAEDSFCVSCGRRLDSEAPDAEVREEPQSTADASVEAEPPKLGRTAHEGYEAGPGTPAGSLSGMLGRLGFWGLLALILVGLIASVVLSPLVLLALVLLFGASLIGVIVRGSQRRSVLRWSGVAVVSVFLAFAFGFISNALYGGVLGSGGADYRVVHSSAIAGETPTLSLSVFSDADDEEGLRAIAEGVIESVNDDEDLVDFAVVEVSVLDPDTTVEDPFEPISGVRPKDPEADPYDLDGNGGVWINFSADNYYDSFRDDSLPPGYYEVFHSGNVGDCDLVGGRDCNLDEVEEYPIPAQ